MNADGVFINSSVFVQQQKQDAPTAIAEAGLLVLMSTVLLVTKASSMSAVTLLELTKLLDG